MIRSVPGGMLVSVAALACPGRNKLICLDSNGTIGHLGIRILDIIPRPDHQRDHQQSEAHPQQGHPQIPGRADGLVRTGHRGWEKVLLNRVSVMTGKWILLILPLD